MAAPDGMVVGLLHNLCFKKQQYYCNSFGSMTTDPPSSASPIANYQRKHSQKQTYLVQVRFRGMFQNCNLGRRKSTLGKA